MAETQRITIYGRQPPCSNHVRLILRRGRRQETIQERNRKYDKPDDFIHHESSDDDEDFVRGEALFLKTSFNFADYIRSREFGAKEFKKFDRQYGSRHILSHDLLKEFPVKTDNLNKIFCSQWLNSRQIVFGTKCNKLIVYDVARRTPHRIPSLSGRQYLRHQEQPLGIYSIQINPSRSLLATVGQNNREIAIYRLPTLDPICVGERGHTNWIYDMCWVDDEYIVTGSKDSNMALWKIDKDLFKTSENENTLNYRWIQPVTVKRCKAAEIIRAMVYNKCYREIAVYSTNSYIHIWSAETFQHKLSRKLPTRHDNPCLAIQNDGVYAIGCQSHTLLLDARTLQAVKKIPSKYSGAGVKSVSFLGSVLTIGTGVGTVMFYDLRAGKYLESSINSNRTVMLRTSRGFVFPDEGYIDGVQNVKYTPAIYTHCYDSAGTRLFCAGGPLVQTLFGNYAGLWQ
ncbi:DDB1- and CUL4-associated factor 12 homolog [Phymastichus coffea]|uniref:DDB1- and CUL4-associated factor 12 homolog n=1 Tax=Phymastichus coffea TaxID=108790 RepID=UPI00273B7521|nr:DDB1- and CUL4-associated factor 12 homolog [Phymastichus coffea]